ncbi:probable G-protein coupled receptor No18 [Saccostrea cucullata]|uniref:probable G-protein coupled receptor No18 n=1 Tax=Saccostrea cuccullata TaxID=36930 RepID=UPI002ED58491
MDNDTYLSEKLEKWNSKLAKGLTPNNVILSLYIIIGLVGNSVVILIYGFKMKGNKEERYFIPFLAFADLWASFVCGSFGIALNMMQAQFNNTDLCKAWWFFAAFTTFCSLFILLIIAVHRYRKVCKPLCKQMTLKWKRVAMCIALITAFTLSVPMTHFYGSVPFPNDAEGITGLRCSRLKTVNKTGSLIFGGILVLAAITIIITLICLYTKIGYTILKHFKYTKTSNNFGTEHASKTDQSQVGVSSSDNPLSDTENGTEDIGLSSIQPAPTSSTATGTPPTIDTTPTVRKTVPFKSSAKKRKEKDNRKVVYKFTLMFMLITVIFLICYIPKVIIMLLEARNPKFWEEFSDSARAGVLFVYRMYIINNITNPFIYAFLDNMFAKQIKHFFRFCRC